MTLHQLTHRSRLPNPVLGDTDARRLLQEHWGIVGELRTLGSQQDLNLRVENPTGGPRHVLKVCRGEYALGELQAQHAAMAHLAAHGLPVPEVRLSLTGKDVISLNVAGHDLHLRVLTYVEGQTLTDETYLAVELRAQMGRLCAQVDQALADFEHPGLERVLQWDPQHAASVISHLLPAVTDASLRRRLEAAGDLALEELAPLAAALPLQPIHLDLTDDNVLWQRNAQRQWMLQGVIDFGDVVRTWRVAELCVTCAAVLAHSGGDPFAILPAVAAYHGVNPLQRAELEALWPMIVGRAVVLLLSSEQQLSTDPDSLYLQTQVAPLRDIFETAVAVPSALMTAAILDATGMGPAPAPVAMAPLLPGLSARAPAGVDLGVLSPLFEAGNWEAPGIDEQLLAEQVQRGGAAYTRYGEYRLSRTRPDCSEAPDTFALHLTLAGIAGLEVIAPFAGTLQRHQDRWVLRSSALSLHLIGLQVEREDGEVAAGECLGVAGNLLTLQLCSVEGVLPPLFTTPERARAWARLCPSPRALLAFDCDAPALADSHALLARRDASFARSQKHYYEAPPQIERGWRNHLIDMQGRSYLDMLNNVAVLGHGHPRMAQVAARQWSLLNTNSRFHYAAIAEFSERLLDLAPEGMDRVFLVNSGTEANDLAIRLAWAYSGGRDMLSVLEAYHGWSVATDAISTSIADNPQALDTRPEWVHPVTAPNTYRGAYRGDDSTAAYVQNVDEVLAPLDAQQRQLAGFICEPVYGNAGGISLPPGYLQQVYAKVRQRGGVCIADEVQVGYGRLGEYFWGFEQQGVVPDIITMAKGMGNGHPLGAVITRKEIAEALEAEGYFFSSAGGSPVSCAIGMAVLDVMQEEDLWNATRDIGRHFKARLTALVDKYPLVGAAHGSGFYLGLELVRSRATLEPATEETTLLCDRLRELGIFMQPTGDYLNILKIKPPMCTSRASVDFFVDCLEQVLEEGL